MIPLREQELLRQLFHDQLKGRVRIDYFTQQRSAIFIPGREECAHCEEVQTLLEEIASLSHRISLNVRDFSREQALAASLAVDKVPATVIRGQTNRPLRYFGVPSGGQFSVLIQALLEAAATPLLQPESVRQLRRLKSDVRLQVLVTPECPYSPAVSLAGLRLALQSVRVKTDVVELEEFPQLAQRFNVRVVPTTIIGERVVLPGAMDEASLVQNVLRVAENRPFSGEPRPAPATPFQPQEEPRQPQTRLTGSGLILPR